MNDIDYTLLLSIQNALMVGIDVFVIAGRDKEGWTTMMGEKQRSILQCVCILSQLGKGRL